MRILNLNKILAGTLTYSNQLEKYKFSDAFEDNALSRWGKFAGNSNQYLQVSFGVATPIYYACLLNTNITATGSVILQCSDNGFSTIAASYNLTRYGGDWIYRNDSGLSYKAYRIVCTELSVTYIRLSKLYLGGYTQMPGMSEIAKPVKSYSKSDKSDSGQLYGYNTIQLRQFNVSFDIVDSETYEAVLDWFAKYDKTKPSFILLYEDSMSTRNNIYGNLTDDLEPKQLVTTGEIHSLSLKIEECK